MWNGRFASLQRSRCLFSIFHSNEPFFRCELQQPTNQLFHSGTVSLLSLSVDGRGHRGRTAISWPFRLLCFRSSLKIQMTSRPARPAPPPFLLSPHPIDRSLRHRRRRCRFHYFVFQFKKSCLPACLSPLLWDSPFLAAIPVSFEPDSVR